MNSKDRGKIKAVLFDMDGVILDSMKYHVSAWKEAMRDFGCDICEELLYLHEGAIEPSTAVDIFCSHGCAMSEEDFAHIFQRQKAIFHAKYAAQVSPYKAVPSMLKTLHENGLCLAMVTSSHLEVVVSTLPATILMYLSHVVTGDRVTRRKPHPDPYLAAAYSLGLKPRECLVVENAPAGIRAAKAAGMECVAITTTLAPHHLREADVTVTNHLALTSFLPMSHRRPD
jgi:beta-phosphoglucomutase